MSGIWTDRNAAWADRDLLWEPRTASAATPRLGAALRAVAPTGATTVAATVAALAAVCLARQPVIRTGLREVLRLAREEGVKVILDGVEEPVSKGALVHIPPGVVRGARGKMRVLVIGVPDIAEDDCFAAAEQ